MTGEPYFRYKINKNKISVENHIHTPTTQHIGSGVYLDFV